MATIVAYTVVGLVGVLFAAMAVLPMLVEGGRKPARRPRHLVLVHNADAAPDATDRPFAA